MASGPRLRRKGSALKSGHDSAPVTPARAVRSGLPSHDQPVRLALSRAFGRSGRAGAERVSIRETVHGVVRQ